MAREALSSALASLPINPNQPPPAYELVVDPSAPIPNLRSPYDPITEEEKEDTDDEEMEDDDEEEEEMATKKDDSEVTINAGTQIRGHGNIISMSPMDGGRIVGVLVGLLGGGSVTPTSQSTAPSSALEMATAMANTNSNSNSSSPASATPVPTQIQRTFQLKNPSRRITITLNCGSTVVGDRNIVGPGLGEIARQMSAGRQTQTSTTMPTTTPTTTTTPTSTTTSTPTTTPISTQGTRQAPQGSIPVSVAEQAPTPPASRTPSLGGVTSSSSAKRKGSEDGAGSPRKRSK
ncbi:hypothetical protein BCR34DRAFT_593640 [Clohesyomyces aquaticus]|uniref:Uncharacterized protein n=1 Tax=Clohesyomyces aquaticus TaxID=1231657 RepID=A0A1Y1YGB5_9PLEO|nr:hypothetical protein BCR34DRAFT_593640 [Clohesyomyces aquaticus]